MAWVTNLPPLGNFVTHAARNDRGRLTLSLGDSNHAGGKRATALRAPTSPDSPPSNSSPHRAEQPAWELQLAQALDQPVEQGRLGGEELLTGGVDAEPACPVDLRELLGAAGARWPLELEGVARNRVRVEVALDRPSGDALAVALADLAELDRRPVGAGAAELLGELASRTRQRLLALLVEALRDAPGAGIAAREERTAWMDEQDFDALAVR